MITLSEYFSTSHSVHYIVIFPYFFQLFSLGSQILLSLKPGLTLFSFRFTSHNLTLFFMKQWRKSRKLSGEMLSLLLFAGSQSCWNFGDCGRLFSFFTHFLAPNGKWRLWRCLYFSLSLPILFRIIKCPLVSSLLQ